MSSSVGNISNPHEQDEVSNQPTNKNSVQFNHLGLAVGPNATHFRAEVGKLVKTHVPISYTDWSLVHKKFKDDLWSELVNKFNLPNHLRGDIEKSMPDIFRKHKSNLRKKILDKQPNLQAQKLAIPVGIKKEYWEQFCINESDEKRQEFRAKAKESRKRSLYGHTGGRKSAAMIEYDMSAKREGSTVTRTEVWIENHTRKDKSILPSAKPFMEKVKAKISEVKESESNNGVHLLSIDDDPLTQVFGKRAKGLPGIGSLISKRKYEAALHPHIMYSEERREKGCLEKKVEKMEEKLDFLYGFCKSKMTDDSVTPKSTPEVEIISTPQPTRKSSTSLPRMIMNNEQVSPLHDIEAETSSRSEPTLTPRMCELYDWDMNLVAYASEVTDPIHKDMCHNYRLNEHEMKLSLCVRMILPAKLYKKTPDATTFQELAVGDFLVWPKALIKFRETRQ